MCTGGVIPPLPYHIIYKIPLDILIIIVLLSKYMPNTYNLYNLEASFKEYLLAGIEKSQINADSNADKRGKGLQKVSVKNYLSDLRHFLGWLSLYINSHDVRVGSSDPNKKDSDTESLQTFITIQTINDYKSYLFENNIPHKTVNRRLSTIRKFCSFCISQGWMKENTGKRVPNVINVGADFISARSRGRFTESPLQNDILNQFQQHLIKQNLDKPTITSSLNTIRELLNTV